MRNVVRSLVVLAAAFVLVVGVAQMTPATAHHGGDQQSGSCDGQRQSDDHQDGGGGDGCQGGATTTTTAPTAPSGSATAPSSASVSIPAHSFSPAAVTVAVGGTVRWTNSDRDSHTVTGDGGSFGSGILASGGTFSHTFRTAGTFAYHCDIHPDMRGTVTVTGAGGSTGSAAPAPAATKTAGSGSSASVAGAAPAGGRSVDRPVSVIDFAFSPGSVSAVVGDTVTWTNRGSAVHTATADNGWFDSGLVKPGGRWRFALTKAGTFRYHCTVHPNMVATIKVAAAGSPVPAVAPAAKGGGTGGVSGAARGTPAARASVAIRDFEFVPPTLTVAKGTTVTWTNRGKAPHTATAVDRSFNSGILQPAGTFSHRFDTLGTFQYLCLVHPNMRGTVIVTRTAALASAASADPPGGQGGTANGAKAKTLDAKSTSSRVNPTLVAALLVAVAASAGLLVIAVAVVAATRKLLAQSQ